jgi:N utilization substance protein B
MSRTTAREVAMMMQFSNMLGGEDTPANVCEKAGDSGLKALDAEDEAYVEQIVSGVNAHQTEIDELSILRVAIYEMLYRNADVPTGAAINEAVELAKRYGGERSYAFVNGILGNVAKEILAT